MNDIRIACMPLVDNVPNPITKAWTETNCPICGRACWETDTYKKIKHTGIFKYACCTECALKKTVNRDNQNDQQK